LLRLIFGWALLAVFSIVSSAQDFGYSIEVEVVQEHADGILAGQTTYRFYAVCDHPADYVSAVYGDSASPLSITSTAPFYQSPYGTETPNGINPLMFSYFPDFEYDSWVTIGIDQMANLGAGQVAVIAISSLDQPWILEFEAGGDVVINDSFGGSWFVTDNYNNGNAGPDLKVLLMQLTTAGVITGTINLQVFEQGQSDVATTSRPVLDFSSISILGCTEQGACNYSSEANQNDGSCDYCSCPEAASTWTDQASYPSDSLDYSLRIERTAIHTGGALDGQSTYRFYIGDLAANDYLGAGFGLDTEPCLIQSTTSFYQDVFGLTVGSSINPILYSFALNLIYDSWVTIGLEDSSSLAAGGYMGVQIVKSPSQDWVASFEAGGEIAIDDTIGGSWYVYNSFSNGIPDAHGEVLIGQFTTDGVISGTLPVQILTYADTGLVADSRISFPFNTSSIVGGWVDIGQCGCLDSLASNFNETALYDNQSCIYIGCADSTSCNFDPIATADDGQCIYNDLCGVCGGDNSTCTDCAGVPNGTSTLDALNVCGGDCTADVDADGVCDVGGIPGCTDAAACNYNITATDDDGSCLSLDVLGVCGGTCEADLDGDNICDEIDPCVGMVDACGICNGPGEIYDCGCWPVAVGACDCEGEVLDECCVCDGGGIAAGDCNCAGDQLDALGICGGNCTSDANANDICDDLEQSLCGANTTWDPATATCIGSGDGTDSCPGDFNGDQVVAIADLLDFLGFFGNNCSD
jgi:hypothetical protein